MIGKTAKEIGFFGMIIFALGVALMGLEKVDFVSYLRKVFLPALLGYLVNIGIYLLRFIESSKRAVLHKGESNFN